MTLLITKSCARSLKVPSRSLHLGVGIFLTVSGASISREGCRQLFLCHSSFFLERVATFCALYKISHYIFFKFGKPLAKAVGTGNRFAAKAAREAEGVSEHSWLRLLYVCDSQRAWDPEVWSQGTVDTADRDARKQMLCCVLRKLQFQSSNP